MALPREFRNFATAGQTPASIAADSSNIGILFDNIDTGNPNRESLFGTIDDTVAVLNEIGVGGQAEFVLPFRFSKNYVTTIENQISGNTEIIDTRTGSGEISSYIIRTRTESGTSYTNRASIADLNSYLASLADTTNPYIELTPTYTSFSGRSDIRLIYKNL